MVYETADTSVARILNVFYSSCFRTVWTDNEYWYILSGLIDSINIQKILATSLASTMQSNKRVCQIENIGHSDLLTCVKIYGNKINLCVK